MSPLPDNSSGSFRVNGQNNRSVHMSTLYHAQWGGTQPQSWPIPVASVATGGASAVAGPNTTSKSIPLTGGLSAGGVMTFDVPRNVVVTVTHATSIVAVTGVITGTDLDGRIIQETFTITATGTTKTATGVKAFKTVTDVTITAVADASADAVTIGSGNGLGLDARSSHISPVKEFMDGAVPTAGVLSVGVWPQTTTADQRGLYTPNAVPNAAHTYDVWYVSDDPWFS